MDRIINVKVGGNYLSKDNKNAGVRGEANVTKLRITFDEGWDGYAKTVSFFDAHGNNPVKRIQGIDLIEDFAISTRTYITPIPAEPMAIAGELTFVIDGYSDGKRQRSISDKLVVKDSPITDNAEEPTDPTPTQVEQLQEQIDGMMNTIQEAVIAGQNAKNSADSALDAQKLAEIYKTQAIVYFHNTEAVRDETIEYADNANLAAEKAENAISHNPVIINGYWHIWSAKHEEYINTYVKAQSGSVVYIGDNPPDDADVIIDPDGESALYAPYIGDNGNWYTFNPETQTFTDSGNRAVAKDGKDGENGADGYTPVKGTDYFTPDEKAEMVQEVLNALPSAEGVAF